MEARTSLNIGIVGAGGFAGFAARAFLQVPGICIVAVTDIDPAAAALLANKFSAKPHTDLDSLLQDTNVDLVYIATPPFLHYAQSRSALLAGKHVICEKPAALRASEAESLAVIAQSKQLLYVVNLMQRYNPLFGIVNRIVRDEILGTFLHGFFENYASDESLDDHHWFWDETKSGGIFIEHGVHFFDLFSGWLGQGKVIHAAQWQREGTATKLIDRVKATVQYEHGPVTFYHGFDQPKILDRQEMRLQFERGDITLYEWVPVRIRLHGILQRSQLDQLIQMLPECSVVHHGSQTVAQTARGRFHDLTFDDHVTLESGNFSEKQNRYREILIAMIQDQWNWIRDRNVKRVIDENNAVASTQMAEDAVNAVKFHASTAPDHSSDSNVPSA